jgi:hypothetical protein
VRRDLFERLNQVKREQGWSTFDQALESLLPESLG